MRKRLIAALAAAGLTIGGMAAATGPAQAIGCTQVPYAAWCDNPPVNVRGDHWHCEQSPWHYTCGWRTGDNRPIDYPGQ